MIRGCASARTRMRAISLACGHACARTRGLFERAIYRHVFTCTQMQKHSETCIHARARINDIRKRASTQARPAPYTIYLTFSAPHSPVSPCPVDFSPAPFPALPNLTMPSFQPPPKNMVAAMPDATPEASS